MALDLILALVKPERVASPQADTLGAVVVGAVLATLSGFAATMLENTFARRRRERDAALLFGEVLSTLKVLLDIADRSRGRGDPYGPITMRLLAAARRELDIYERNREALVEIRKGRLRLDIHSLMVRLSISVDGLLDGASIALRDQGFQFLLGIGKEIEPLMERLARLRGEPFDDFMRETSRALDPPG
ncbi:MAG TPA: hypothetical protein VII73_06405 [Caulobacteraceae bacterium]